MCSNYVPTQGDIWHGLALRPGRPWKAETWPGYEAPFVRRREAGLAGDLGRFGLVPWWTNPDRVKGASRHTYNARSETVAQKPSFRDPWKRGQFCVIPADAFYEPCYETGKPVRWRISRADGKPMAIAGIWDRWSPKDGGEPVESFAMLTINADDHPLMRQFHAPGDEKRMVAILDEGTVDAWLHVSPKEALALLQPFPAERLAARAAPSR